MSKDAARTPGEGGRSQADLRVAYVHGRPAAHPMHLRLAQSVGAEPHPVDFLLRWQDQERSVPYVVASWFLCAAAFPDRSRYDVFLIDNLHFMPVVMKDLFLRRSQKIVVHLGSHTLYFLREHRFSKLVERLHLEALARYDALLCEGHMAQSLARELLGDRCPPTYVTFLGPPRERLGMLSANTPDPTSKRLLTICNGPGGFRIYYKGMDLMLAAFARAVERDPELSLDVVGQWEEEAKRSLLAGIPAGAREKVRFRGTLTADGIRELLRGCGLYLQCSRGDAFPTASLEAMHAGLVPIVTEWTGTREVVDRVDPRLVCPIVPEAIATAIVEFFNWPESERRALSARARVAAAGFTEESAIAHYQATFRRACDDLGVTEPSLRRT